MQIFFDLLYLFAIGSILGWILEIVYRSIVSKKIVNPGFLNGPYLPIYGFGVMSLYILCSLKLPIWCLIVVCVVLMTLIEYIAGIIFIKGMGIKLWDYSKRWGNIQGIICPLFSAVWGVLGVLYLLFVFPNMTNALKFLSGNLYFLFILGMFYATLIIDFFQTTQVSSKITAKFKESKIVVNYEKLKQRIQDDLKKTKRKRYFFFQFKNRDKDFDEISNAIENSDETEKDKTENA